MDIVSALAGNGIYAFMLVLARISGAFMTAPVFSSKLIPVRAKLILALGFSLAATPIAMQGAVPTDTVMLAVLAVKEVLVGAAIAFSAAVIFAAVAFAGSLIDLTVGFSFANVVDPLQNAQISVIGQVYSLVASVVFVCIGGPEMVLASLVRSFDVVPVGTMPNFAGLTRAAIASMGDLFSVGLQIAAPIVIALLVTDAGIGVLARLAPSMNIFAIELPAKVTVALVLLALTAPLFVGSVAMHLNEGLNQMVQLLLGSSG